MRIQARRLPARRYSWLFIAIASLAFFSSMASAQTADTTTATTTSPPPSARSTDSSLTKPLTDTTSGGTESLIAPTPPTTTSYVPPPAVWTPLVGLAKDVSHGGSGLWVVGTNVAPNGYGLWRWVNGTRTSMVSSGATRIDVDAAGALWTVDNRGIVLRYPTAGTQVGMGSSPAAVVGTGATDIGAGGAGPYSAVWKIGNIAEGGANFGIYRYNASTLAWTKVPGSALRVDVDPSGNAWVVNAAGAIFRWGGTGWIYVPGVFARDVGVGNDGSVFAAGTDDAIYRWSGSAWVKRSGAGVSISVSPAGVPVVVNSAGQIYTGWR